jgi:hypothetical protein
MRRLTIRLLLLALFAASIWGTAAVRSWSYQHPSVFHDCRMLAALCPSRTAAWIPNGGSVPLYGKCACTATLHVGVTTR